MFITFFLYWTRINVASRMMGNYLVRFWGQLLYTLTLSLLVLIELISYLARAVSLGVRLFANITAGHTLLKILSTYLFKLFSGSLLVAIITLIPFSIFLALIGLEIAVSLIQAFVFTLLVCSYLKDAIALH